MECLWSDCPWWTQPDWWTAIGTGCLVVITGAAVFFGARAAKAAVRAFQLEAEPVLVLTRTLTSPSRSYEMSSVGGRYAIDFTDWYIIRKDDNKRIVFERDVEHKLKTRMVAPPGAFLEIRNVGRSPAIGVTMRLYIYEGEHQSLKSLRTQPPNCGLLLDGIGPQSSYFLGVSNQLTGEVRFKADAWGTQVVYSSVKRMGDKPKTKRLQIISRQIVLFSQRPKNEQVLGTTSSENR